MIFFVANDGTIIKTLPSPVYQGGANTNTIYLVAPFAENLSATVRFQLPNGIWTTPALMANGLADASAMTGQGSVEGIVDKDTGQQYAVWTYALPNTITQYYGTVTAQFFFYAAKGGVVTPTSAASFTVQRGVPTVLPDTPSQDIYEQILSAISDLRGQFDNGNITARSVYAWNSTYTYGANEIVYVPNVGEFGAFVKSIAVNNLNHPPYVDGVLDTRYWETVLDFNQLNKAIVLWGFNEPTEISDLDWTEI